MLHHEAALALPLGAQVVLAKLYWHRNKTTGQLNPRHLTLGREIGRSWSTIRNHIRILRERQFISATKGRRGNHYEIRPQEDWRKPEKLSLGKSLKQLCEATCGQPKIAKQDAPVLYERETLLLNESNGAAAAFSGVVEERAEAEKTGGGGSPAALDKDVRKATGRPDPPTNVSHVSHISHDHFPEADEMVSCPVEADNSQSVVQNPQLPVSRPQMREQNEQSASELVTELLAVHPQPGNPNAAVAAIASVLESGSSLEEIRANHAQWRKMWAVCRIGRFIPQLWRWIRDNDWRYPPTEQQIQAARDPERADEERMARIRADAPAREAERKREFLERLRKARCLPAAIEREMQRNGFGPTEIDAEMRAQGWAA